jgi:hypothetical protein
MCLAAGWLAFLAAIRTLDALAPIQHSGSSPAVELALLATAAVALAACGVATIRWLA